MFVPTFLSNVLMKKVEKVLCIAFPCSRINNLQSKYGVDNNLLISKCLRRRVEAQLAAGGSAEWPAHNVASPQSVTKAGQTRFNTG